MTAFTPWTEEETGILRALLVEGKTYTEIAEATNRSYASVKARVRRINIPKTARDAANIKKMASRAIKRGPQKRRYLFEVDRRPEVPDEVIHDAARRAMAPRDLTATLMGDPPVGFSALEART